MALERQNGDSGSKGAEGVQRRQIFDVMNDTALSRHKIVERAMSKDFSWKNSAGQYQELYKSLIGE